MREEISLKELATKKDISVLSKDITELELRLEIKMAHMRTELIKWVLSVGIASVTVLMGGMATFFHLAHLI